MDTCICLQARKICTKKFLILPVKCGKFSIILHYGPLTKTYNQPQNAVFDCVDK